MSEPASPLSASRRGRLTALMLATGTVAAAFALLALLNPHLGGQPRGPVAGLGAAIFAVVLLGLWLRQGTTASTQVTAVPPRPPSTPGLGKKLAALLVIAVLLWLMAGLFWYFALSGSNLRYGMDPLLLAVPLTIYPVLIITTGNHLRKASRTMQ